jgi:acetolactate synthase-1/2/3 large subunit
VLVVIVDNGVLGMVRQWQNLFYEERYSETTLDRPPDFVKLADAYGAAGFKADTEEEFSKALDAAIEKMAGTGSAGSAASCQTAVIDARINENDMVLPMVPGGKPIDEQILQ